MALNFDHTTLGQRVLFGRNAAVDHTVKALEDLGARRVLLIAGNSARTTSDAITDRVNVVARIHDIVQHVPAERADDATALATNHDADAMVTIGGGSATGLAKMVALRTGIPIVAVPTTFSGSEATNIWGLTTDQRKETGADPRVLPSAVVYDASLIATLPHKLAISSGLNGLAHAVDALWAKNANPINQALATEGARALIPALRRLASHADDLDAREEILFGAYLSAVAFASAGSGMHHKICHVLGGAYNLPHADLHAVVLPYVAAFNMSHAPDAAARVARAFELPLTGSDLETAHAAARGLWRLREEAGAPTSLEAIGMREDDLEEAATLVLSAIPETNPRSVELADLQHLLRAAWAGEPASER